MATHPTPPRKPAGTSKRYTNFIDAWQLATERACTKWTYDDLCACFPTWCSEQPDQSAAVRTEIGRQMQAYTAEKAQEYLNAYCAAESIDMLNETVLDARERERGDAAGGAASARPKDSWRAELDPRAAVRARVVPVLMRERDRLRREIEEVESQNQALLTQIKASNLLKNEADHSVSKAMDALDKAVQTWSALPMADLEAWSIDAVEAKPLVHE